MARKPCLEVTASLQMQDSPEIVGPGQRVIAVGLLEPPAGFVDDLQPATDFSRGFVAESQDIPHYPLTPQRGARPGREPRCSQFTATLAFVPQASRHRGL